MTAVWRAVLLANGERHVLPLEDLRPHETAIDCWCHPAEAEPGIWAHRSLDRREDYETGKLVKA